MSVSRRLFFSTVWTFVVGIYRRLELDIVSPVIEHIRGLLSAESSQPLLVDCALFLIALAVFVWMCNALRHNWVFQWLAYFVYQIIAFVFFSYGALFSWQTMVFIALVYPDYLEPLRKLLFEVN